MSKMVLTSAGIAEIVNAEKNGTAPVKLSHVAFGTGQYTATAERTALQAEFKRFDAISGGGVGDNLIHVSVQDETLDSYTVYEIGVFTENGTLFAVYSQTTPINTKAEQAILMQDISITLGEMNPESIVIGDTNFQFNRATTEREGVIELATEAEAKAATDTERAITAATLQAVIQNHSNIVHRSGVETIAGVKTFLEILTVAKENPAVCIKQIDVIRGTKPSVNQSAGFEFLDNNGTRLGYLESLYDTNGDLKLSLYAYKPLSDKNSYTCAGLSVIYPQNGEPYITVPMPPINDNDNKIAVTAWVNNRLSNYLPLTGGTMTGAITLDGTASVFAADRDLWFAHSTGNTAYRAAMLAGDAYNTGASLYMHGKDYESNPGQFCLQAHDGTNLSALVGNPDGTLVWKNLVFSYGNLKKNDKTSGLNICSGRAYNDSPALSLYPSDYATDPDMAGRFVLRAGENEYQLVGKPDGTLTWGGKNITKEGDCLPVTGGTVKGNITLHGYILSPDANGDIGFYGGTGSANGGYMILFGQNCSSATYQGGFQIVVSENGNKHVLQGFKTGSITWKGYELERVNSVGSNYIRFESGVQICWGTVSNSANNTTITFPKAFINSNTGVSITPVGQISSLYVSSLDTAKMIIAGTYSGSSTRWTAIGKWK